MFFSKYISLLIIVLIAALSAFLFLVDWETESINQDDQSQFGSLSLDNKVVFTCQDRTNWGIFYWDEQTGQGGLLIDSMFDEYSPLVLPDKNQLLFLREDQDYNRLVLWSLQSGEKEDLVFSTHQISEIKISPDGKKLLFQEKNNNGLLYFYDREKDWQVRIAQEVQSFAWNKNGDKFVYVIDDFMYLAAIDWQNRQISEGIEVVDQVSSPIPLSAAQDTFLAVSQSENGVNLVLVDAINKTKKVFSQIEFAVEDDYQFTISYSPDQSKILLNVVSNDSLSTSKTWVVGRSGQSIQGILTDAENPIWSNDGQSIIYLKSDQGEDRQLWSYHLLSRSSERLTGWQNCRSLNNYYLRSNYK